MFSSVVFHDHARERGLKPILGCEVYVAQGSRFDKSGPQTETNHLVLLAETDEGYKNLIKLVSSGYTEGFYYRPRIDKELLAQHAKGLIGLSSCLQGRSGERAEDRAGAAGARSRGAAARHSRPEQLLPRDAVSGHRGAEDGHQRDRAAGARAQPPARRDQRRALSASGRLPAARHPAVHRHRQDRQRCAAPALHGRSVLPEDRASRWRPCSRTIRRRCRTRCSSPSAATSRFRRGRTTCRRSRCPRAPRSISTSSTSPAKGFAQRLPRLRQLPAAGRPAHSIDEYERRLDYEIAMIHQMGYAGLLPHRLGLHPLRARGGHPGRAWPRIGRRLARRLVHAHHRRRSARLRSDLRALPQPRARVAARHRRGFLRAAPRRSDRLRHPQVRPRERRADHHVRDDEGEGGGARRRPRARHAVRRCRPHREADPAGARHDARQGARREPGPQGHGGARRQGQRGHRHRQASRGHVAPRLGPRRRRGDRARARSPTTRRSTKGRATKSRRSGT